mmetsp:Transcript_110502/g.330589  ORF Transcript_110502/g.330589 Transcript_110502/m.330589 type:complete len:335 (-) Transcript_110502:172-1176(-)
MPSLKVRARFSTEPGPPPGATGAIDDPQPSPPRPAGVPPPKARRRSTAMCSMLSLKVRAMRCCNNCPGTYCCPRPGDQGDAGASSPTASDSQRGCTPKCETQSLSPGSLCSSSRTRASTSSSCCLLSASLSNWGGSIRRCTGETETVMAVPLPACADPAAINGFFFFPARLGASRAPTAARAPCAADHADGTPPASSAILGSSDSQSGPRTSHNSSLTSASPVSGALAGAGLGAGAGGGAGTFAAHRPPSSEAALCLVMPLRRCFVRLCIDITCNSREVIFSTSQPSSVGSAISSPGAAPPPPLAGAITEFCHIRTLASTTSWLGCCTVPLGFM